MLIGYSLSLAEMKFVEDRDQVGPSSQTVWFLWPSDTWSVKYIEGDLMRDATNGFSTHWAMDPRKTVTDSTGVHVSYRACQGVLRCSQEECTGIVRPRAKLSEVRRQLVTERCPISGCNGILKHILCDAKCDVQRHPDGTMTFSHRGIHAHRCPPKIHLNPDTAKKFRKFVETNPRRTAVQLLTGTSIEGDGKSIMNLDLSLANIDRLAYHRKKALMHGTQPSRGGDKFVNSLAEFMQKHPNFVTFHQFSPVILVAMQTRYMATCMVEEILRGDARQGFVTDANHGFFVSDRKYLLTTTTFSVSLKRWVPVFLAYSGGQTEEDYQTYFYQLFASMHRSLGTESDITDEDYAQVCLIP